MDYYGGLSLLSGRELAERLPRLLDEVGLADRAGEPISAFSKGMLQRLALAQALINDPELLVLDEPTEGMDLSARKLLQRVILRRKQEGKTAIIVSHSMADVRRLCDEAAVLRGGQVVFRGSLAELTGQRPADVDAEALQDALDPIYAGGDCPNLRRDRLAAYASTSPAAKMGLSPLRREHAHERQCRLFRHFSIGQGYVSSIDGSWHLLAADGYEHDLHRRLPERERNRPALAGRAGRERRRFLPRFDRDAAGPAQAASFRRGGRRRHAEPGLRRGPRGGAPATFPPRSISCS